jgi:nucleoside-diphosphate-sugar epimerase
VRNPSGVSKRPATRWLRYGGAMRVLFVGGTGPVGQAAVPHLLAAGHDVVLAHTGAHEPPALAALEHLHGDRDALLAPGGPAERARPDAIVDTFAGGASEAKARALSELGQRAGAARLVVTSSIDVYRHCTDAGVDDGRPTELPRAWLPLTEDSELRTGPSPGGAARGHDNVAMERALTGAERITILRPGAIYGPYDDPHVLREWYLVGKVARGERRLPLPAGGTQLFQRVAVDRVGRAIAAALEHAPAGTWACHVADPRDLTFGGLAALVAERLGWEWEPEDVPWADGDHPWNVRHPIVADTTRLRDVLGVHAPDPHEATVAQIDWLWEQRAALAA